MVLEYVLDRERLIEREQHYIDALQPEYNIAPLAGSLLGFKHSEAAKQKMSEAHKGKALSDETKRKLSEAQMGHTVSEEARQKMSDANRGRALSEEHRQKLSEVRMGHTVSEETRQKMSRAKKLRDAMRGERCPSAKLSEQDVRDIKALLVEGVLLQGEIAARYGVHRTTIVHINCGDTWAHIEVAIA